MLLASIHHPMSPDSSAPIVQWVQKYSISLIRVTAWNIEHVWGSNTGSTTTRPWHPLVLPGVALETNPTVCHQQFPSRHSTLPNYKCVKIDWVPHPGAHDGNSSSNKPKWLRTCHKPSVSIHVTSWRLAFNAWHHTWMQWMKASQYWSWTLIVYRKQKTSSTQSPVFCASLLRAFLPKWCIKLPVGGPDPCWNS